MLSRYVLEGIASDLEGGAEIAVFVPQYQSVINVIHQVTEYTDDAYTQVKLPTGEILHESGGRIRLYWDYLRARGASFDVIVIPHGSASDFLYRLDPRVEIIEY